MKVGSLDSWDHSLGCANLTLNGTSNRGLNHLMNSSGLVRIADYGRDDRFCSVVSWHCCDLGFGSDCVGFAERVRRNGSFRLVHVLVEMDIDGLRRS